MNPWIRSPAVVIEGYAADGDLPWDSDEINAILLRIIEANVDPIVFELAVAKAAF